LDELPALSASGGSVRLRFSTDETWRAETSGSASDEEWYSVSPRSGGAGEECSVTIRTSANAEPAPRSFTLTLRTLSLETSVEVTQRGCNSILLGEGRLDISADEQKLSVAVRPDAEFTVEISEPADWLSEVESEDAGCRVFHVSKNTSGQERTGTVLFHSAADDYCDELVVVQSAEALVLVGEPMRRIGREEQSVLVEHSKDYLHTIASGSDWLTFESSEISPDNTSLYKRLFRAAMNPSSSERTAVIRFRHRSDSRQTFDVTVIQSGWEAASDERAALEALYASAGGPGWTCSENWCGDKPLDEWYGVQTDDEGHVISLSLCDNNLRGTLPGELVALSRLRRLDLSRNALNGTVLNANDGTIDYLHLLSELESVDLSRNNFEGRLPAAWCDMPNLKFLDVSSNRLSGGINYKWGAMFEGGRYVDLVLNGNYLSSPVPAAMQNHYLWGKLALQIMRQYGYFEGGEISGIGLDYDKDVYMPDFTFIDLATAAPRSIRDLYSANKLTMLLHWNPLQEESCDFAETVVRRYHTLFGKDGFAVLALIPEGEEYSDAALRYLREHDAGWSAAAEYFDTEGNRPVLPCEPFPSYQLMDTYGKVTLDMYDGKYGALSMADNWLVEMSSFAHMDYLNKVFKDAIGQSSYESTDYSMDKRYETIRRATKGKGIDVIFIGEAFTDIDIETGFYMKMMEYITDYYFSGEPIKTYKDYFNIHVIYAVSRRPHITTNSSDVALGTILSSDIGPYGHQGIKNMMNGWPDEYVRLPLEYGKTPFTSIILNDSYVGFSSMGKNYTSWSYAFCGYGYGARTLHLTSTFVHESVGHVFGGLADEYINPKTPNAYNMPDGIKESIKECQNNGLYLNVSLTDDPRLVPWAHLIGHPRFSGAGMVGVYNGGYGYAKPIWNSYKLQAGNNASIMNTGTVYYFNPVCRELLVKRIMYFAGEEYSFEKFLANDKDEIMSSLKHSRYIRRNTEYKHCPPVLME
ncbi:MAG: hypothetical protein K2J33_03405, partial [Alistipes sp.]|nr:hypothetical protein [Alistipes sp.]